MSPIAQNLKAWKDNLEICLGNEQQHFATYSLSRSMF